MCLGVPGRVLARDDADTALPMGVVDFDGVRRDVCLAYTPEARVGDYVIVHVGFAISQVDELEAQRTYGMLRAMNPDLVAQELGGEPAPDSEPPR